MNHASEKTQRGAIVTTRNLWPKLRGLASRLAVIAFLLAPSPAFADTFLYDSLGRLTKVQYDNGGYIVYAYDANGNRSTVAISTHGEAPPPPPSSTAGRPVIVVPLGGFLVIPLPAAQ